ncbi:TPM domain-containing protein [Undibacterium sp. TJN19]|uniref:TPM domain-containing protein n=1 Tax=Undibacterium sp. TJN19 TaxID=3413055 RepID=UPI003BF0DCB7
MNKIDIERIIRHMLSSHRQVARCFPKASLRAIEQAITASETDHLGEIRFVIENALDCLPLLKGQTARERALDVFSQLRVWDTEHNNGVLIYVLLADRDVEIVADRGIHAKSISDEWEQICRMMESAFRQDQYEDGVIRGIQAIGQHLKKHFPADEPAIPENKNELPDAPVLL